MQTTPLLAGFYRQVQDNPEQPAFTIDEQVTTFGELASLVAGIGRQLEGSGPGRIALALPNSVEVAAWYIASVQHRQTLFLLDFDWPAETLQAALAVADPHLLVITDSIAANARVGASENSVVSEATNGSVVVQACEPACPVDTTWYRDDDFAFFAGFTSGSSGVPKVFLRDTCTWLSSFNRSATEFGLTTESVQIAAGPLSHGLSFYAMAESLFLGIPFCTQTKFEAARLLQMLGSVDSHISSAACVNLVVVPTMLFRIAKELEAESNTVRLCDKLRIVSAGAKLGAPLKQRLLSAYPNLQISEYYGASELSFVSVNHHAENRPDQSVGRLFEGVEVAVMDSKMHSLEPGAVGLLHVRSDMVATGYIRRNTGGFKVDPLAGTPPWCTVGDRASMDANGNLYLDDRMDRMLISGGLNVYPSRVEAVINSLLLESSGSGIESRLLALVAGCEHKVICGLPEEQWGDRICLVLAPYRLPASVGENDVDWEQLTELKQALFAGCRPLLESHAIPRLLFIADSLPMTSSGKVAFRQLQETLLDPLARKSCGMIEI